MNVLYISTAITENELKNQKRYLKVNKNYTQSGMLESTMKFHGLILKGLSYDEDVSIIALSGRCVSSKSYNKFFWKGKNEEINKSLIYKYVATINFPILKQLFNILQFTFNILKWMYKNRKEEKVIIIDGAYVSIIPIVAKISKCKKICIVADIYDYMANVNNNNDKKVKGLKNIIAKSYKKMDGYIFLTKKMNNVMNKEQKPYIVIEGIVDVNELADATNEKIEDKLVILYAGALNEKYGLKNLIDAFKAYKNKDAELVLYGDGSYVDTIIKESKEDKRIKFKGVADNSKIVEEEKKATLLVNPRQNVEEFTKYSFPSKNMEYMKSGTPMLGVKLDGIPEEYYDYMYTMENGNSEEILEKFKEILDESTKEEREKLGNKAKQFVLNNKNNIYQSKKIINFIKTGDL